MFGEECGSQSWSKDVNQPLKLFVLNKIQIFLLIDQLSVFVDGSKLLSQLLLSSMTSISADIASSIETFNSSGKEFI